jgi:hypothetical protein
VPGEAWLEYRAEPDGAGTRLIQEAHFVPRGWLGLLYWYAMLPAHHMIFPRLVRSLCARAASLAIRATALAINTVPVDDLS